MASTKFPCLCIALLIITLCSIVYPQQNAIQFNHLSLEQGMSQSTGMCMVQDKKGFIWIGTEDGLDRYDGYTFKIYKPQLGDSTSISSNSIWALLLDSAGVLWVGTFDGLNAFDPYTERFTRYMASADDSTRLSNKYVRALCEDKTQQLWAGTYGGGLCLLDKATGRFRRFTHDPGNQSTISNDYILSLYKDHDGNLWIGTEHGLSVYDRHCGYFMRFYHDPVDPFSISSDTVWTIMEDDERTLWVGTVNGLNKYNRQTKKFERFYAKPSSGYGLSNNDIRALMQDSDGALWIGTEFGLNRYTNERDVFVNFLNDPNDPASLFKNEMRSLLEDRSGVIWVGLYGGGLACFEREHKKFIHYRSDPRLANSLNINYVHSICAEGDSLVWIGTFGGGLNRLDRRTGAFSFFMNNPANPHSISYDKIRSLCIDRTGKLWVGTWGGGLNFFDRHTGSFTALRHNPENENTISADIIRTIREDTTGLLWLGTEGGGLNSLDPVTMKVVRYVNDPADSTSISSNRIFDILQTTDGDLWITTFGGGLNRFNRKTGKFTHYQHDPANPNSLVYDYVMGLYEDRQHNLWIGSDGKGLNKFDVARGTFTLYTEAHGLTSSVVYAILADARNNLWMSTNLGLFKFDPLTETFKNYSPRDGIQSNEFNGLCSFKNEKTGEMLFGGVNGFNLFHPDSIQNNYYLPQIVLTNFQLFNRDVVVGVPVHGRVLLHKSISETDSVELSYHENILSFEFSGLHYVNPELNRYAYILDGFETGWNYVSSSRRYMTYTNLAPGSYTLRVKGCNSDGVWNEQGTAVKITIVPPYWRTWWFYVLCTLFALGVLVALYRYRISRIKQQKALEERLKVFNDMSHILEHGRATVYRRPFDSDTYDYMGKGITNITGYNPEELSLSLWYRIATRTEMVGDNNQISMQEALQQMREGKLDSYVMDVEFKTKSGELRWTRDITTALYDTSGHCTATLGIVFDITDRKVAEQELVRISDELLQSSKQLRSKNREMETDLEMAREIQLSFLNKHVDHFPAHLPGNEVSLLFTHHYTPASILAGDFFDILPISDHEVGLLICDVMGHGARASMLTFYLRGLVEEIAAQAYDPGPFMSRLNDGLNAIMGRFKTGMFATAFYCIIDCKAGTMRYVNAGHPAPFILHGEEARVETVAPVNTSDSGPAIGIQKEYAFTTNTHRVAAGDVLFLYTDGLFEVSNSEGALFGRTGLKRSLTKICALQPGQMMEELFSQIKAFAEIHELRDDVCMVSVQIKKLMR